MISLPPATSRESLSMDSGNPSPDTTFTSERVSRSPPGHGSESDSRSLDLDSLSVDDIGELEPRPEAGATVIHVMAGSPLDESVQSAEVSVDARALTTVQTSL